MLVPELKKLKLQSQLVSIERDCHDEELTGYICDIDDQITSMHLFDNDGVYEGFTVFETEQITEVYWGNREHLAIAHLASQNAPKTTPKLESKDFQEIITEFNSKHESLCFHAGGNEDAYDIASITEFDDTWFKLKTFSIKKSLSPLHKLILRESITRIVVNSPYQNKIVELHSAKL